MLFLPFVLLWEYRWYKEQESKLAQQYQQELQISENLKDKEQYVHTDEYLEEMARKLGLLYPDEVIFKPED